MANIKTPQPSHVIFWLTLLAVVLQIFLILGLFLSNLSVTNNSIEIALKLSPVDPRDRFRGDYMDLRYEINSIKVSQGESKTGSGLTTYLPLTLSAPSQNSKVPTGFFQQGGTDLKFDPNPNEPINRISQSYEVIYIKGIIDFCSSASNSIDYGYNYYNTTCNIKYGIEQYFIPEGSGNNPELNKRLANNPDGVYGIVKVNLATGEARLDRMEIDGKKWPE